MKVLTEQEYQELSILLDLIEEEYSKVSVRLGGPTFRKFLKDKYSFKEQSCDGLTSLRELRDE